MKYILGVNGKILHEFYAVEVNYKYSGARHGHLTTSAAKVVRHVTIEVLRHTGHIAVIQITGSNSAVTLGLRPILHVGADPDRPGLVLWHSFFLRSAL